MQISRALNLAVSPRLTRLEAQWLMLHVLARMPHERAWLLAHDDQVLDASAWALFQACCQRRLEGEPVAYITGHTSFFGLDLIVDNRVLDPRADTETLVDWCLEHLEAAHSARVLDLGTGSGAIALAVAHARPRAEVTAIDASTGALAVAQANAARLGLQIDFRQGDWFAATPPLPYRFDVIVSNPPYIRSGDTHLAALTHEPLSALVSAADGLNDLRQIIDAAPQHLAQGGWLLLEHGYDQAQAVRGLLAAQGFTQIRSRTDINGIERCSGGQFERMSPLQAQGQS